VLILYKSGLQLILSYLTFHRAPHAVNKCLEQVRGYGGNPRCELSPLPGGHSKQRSLSQLSLALSQDSPSTRDKEIQSQSARGRQMKRGLCILHKVGGILIFRDIQYTIYIAPLLRLLLRSTPDSSSAKKSSFKPTCRVECV